jgi:fibronectin type 3 domain-containing protein
VESLASEEACIEVKDVAAPAAPSGLAVIVEGRAVALSWSPAMDLDLAHYRVYRSVDRGSPERIAELPPDRTSFRDESLAPAAAARYTVTAVDAAGNESEPSAATPARLP